MRRFSKFVLVAAVAVLAIAIAAVPSEAATKKKKKAAAAAPETAQVIPASARGCTDVALCAKNCGPQGCECISAASTSNGIRHC